MFRCVNLEPESTVAAAVEWESTIRIPITEDIFLKATKSSSSSSSSSSSLPNSLNNNNDNNNFNNENNKDLAKTNTDINEPKDFDKFNSNHNKPFSLCKDIIFLFDNNTRLSQRHLQSKVTTNEMKVLSFFNNNWFPIQRTKAIEQLASLTADTTINVTKIIYRIITYRDSYGLRVAYNKEYTQLGCKFSVTYEVEYPENTKYKKILACERKLMHRVLNDGYIVGRERMSLDNIFSCIPSKVQMWHCFNPRYNYIWAYKWNGVKAKMLITDKKTENGSYLTYLWPDAKRISTNVCFSNSRLDILINLCILVEIMNDCIVIIEVIGSLIHDDIYKTEPVSNAAVLRHLNNNLPTDIRIGEVPLIVQKFYPKPMPNTYDYGKFDGFIVIQNDLIIKWKQPTIDVKCIDKNKYSVGDGHEFLLSFYGETDGIYEMSCDNTILRKRNDRLVAGTEQEYKVFCNSRNHLQSLLKK